MQFDTASRSDKIDFSLKILATMINVGIIGCGFVGGALKDWLEHNNPECKLFISDPPKGYNDDLSNIDIAFLQIHVPTVEHRI